MENKSVDELVAELEAEGILAPDSAKNNNIANNEIDIINNIEKASGVTFSEEQRNILLHHGSMVILACAGSGKTTININLLAKRVLNGEITEPEKVVYTTYSKSGQLEMKERLDKLFKQLNIHSEIEVRTLHSFFLQILRTFGIRAGVIDAGHRLRIIKKAANDVQLKLQGDDLQILDNLLSYQVNNLLNDEKTLASSANTIENMTKEQYSEIRQTYASEKAKANLIDYDDMQSYLYLWMIKWGKSENIQEKTLSQQVINYCKSIYDSFYVDEAQDISKIQFIILKTIICRQDDASKLEKELVFIGDDDQAIYSWRGSDPSIILSVGAQFNINTFVLSTNYRCLSNIVDYATTGIKCNSSRFNKGMSALNQGGTVKIYPSSKTDLCSLSEIAMNQIKYWISKGENITDIAVLARNNSHLAILNNMLMNNGIYSNISDNMKLTKSTIYSDVNGCVELAGALSDNGECYKSALTASLLWHMCSYLGAANASQISKFQNNNGLSFKDLVGYLSLRYVNSGCVFNKKLSISQADLNKLDRIMSRISYDAKEAIQEIYTALCDNNIATRINSLLSIYRIGSKFLYKSADKKRTVDGVIKYIKGLIDKDGIQKTLDFLHVTEQLEGGNMIITDDKVTLTTIHSAKGREWKNVIMFACDNVSEPALGYINQLADSGMSRADIDNYIDEERRLFYVGNTRAKNNLFIITYDNPSVFILEALGEFNNIPGGNNDNILAMANNCEIIDQYKKQFKLKVLSETGEYHYNISDYSVDGFTF